MPDDPESFTTEESGPVVLWPTVAMNAALDERERLLGVIDRAADLLGSYLNECPPGHVPTAIRDALAILAEADPIDPETGERMGDRDG